MDPMFSSPGMMQGGLLKAREAYGQYAADVMSRGEQPAPFEVWVRAQSEAAPQAGTHVMPDGSTMSNAAMPARAAPPQSGIVQRMQSREDAELEARRAEQAAIMRAAQEKMRRRQPIPARSGQVY